MNELIKELAKQHLMHSRYGPYHEYIEGDYYEFDPEELDQFSKLIIEECAKEIQSFVDLRIPASEYPMKLKMNMGLHDEL